MALTRDRETLDFCWDGPLLFFATFKFFILLCESYLIRVCSRKEMRVCMQTESEFGILLFISFGRNGMNEISAAISFGGLEIQLQKNMLGCHKDL